MRNTGKKRCIFGADAPPQTSESTCASVFVHVLLLALCTRHTSFGFRVSGYTSVPVITRGIKVQLVPFPVVVVQGGVAVLHVAVLGFFPGVFALVV